MIYFIKYKWNNYCGESIIKNNKFNFYKCRAKYILKPLPHECKMLVEFGLVKLQ